MADPHADPIELVPSRHEGWRAAFERERDRVRDALGARGFDGAVGRVAHVGSTAVPDLPARDVVDLDVVVADDAVAAVSRALVADLGGDRVENSEAWHPVFREHGGQRFDDHVFAASSEKWRVSVASRDVLRARPDLRAEYEAQTRPGGRPRRPRSVLRRQDGVRDATAPRGARRRRSRVRLRRARGAVRRGGRSITGNYNELRSITPNYIRGVVVECRRRVSS